MEGVREIYNDRGIILERVDLNGLLLYVCMTGSLKRPALGESNPAARHWKKLLQEFSAGWDTDSIWDLTHAYFRRKL